MKKNIELSKKYSLVVKNYTKRFKKFLAVDDVSFSVSHGKIHGFIGPNGAGKTTTIKAMIGAYDKSKGEIYIEGFPAGSPKAKSKIGYIPERASFPKQMTCLEYLVSMAELSGFKPKLAKQKSLEILKELELLKHKHRKPFTFSSGMKKKILVAQALMLNPTLLILDEPAANLDPTARKDMFEMFKKVKRNGCSILISSHILSELQDIVDEVTFISQGQIRFTGSITDLASDNGMVVNFGVFDNKAKNVIKKYKLEETTSGWVKQTATLAQAKKVAKSIISESALITHIAFLNSNLNHAYDKLVVQHGRESGVEKEKKKSIWSKFKFKKQIKEPKVTKPTTKEPKVTKSTTKKPKKKKTTKTKSTIKKTKGGK